MNKSFEKKEPTLAIACGGTGGHFFPGLTIAKEYNRRGGKTTLFIAGHQIQNHLNIASDERINAVKTHAIRLPSKRRNLPVFSIQFVYALLVNLILMRRERIDAALCMGSYASAPLGIAAVLAGKPLILHEGNAILGKTNRYLSKRAELLVRSFPLKNRASMQVRQKAIGMPLRESIIKAGAMKMDEQYLKNAYQKYNLVPGRLTLLVFGGSQGAETINGLLVNAIDQMKEALLKFQIIHLTGKDDNAEVKNLYQSKRLKYVVKKRDDEIEKLYQIADLVVCRAGASTIFELAYFGKPALYIPMAAAAENHQKENVVRILEVDGGVLLEETSNLPQEFLRFIEHWLRAPDEFVRKGQNLKKIARPNATGNIVETINRCVADRQK